MLKLILVFAGIVIALRKNLFVGYTLFAAGLVIALLFGEPIMKILLGYRDVLLSSRFFNILGIIILISFMGRILKDIGFLDKLVDASSKLKGGARTAAVAMPLLVGMMPMPGGALLSAPLIARVLPREKYSAEFATVVNYWDRHIIEFIWPVYPGIIMASALSTIPFDTIALVNLPMSLSMAIIGYIFIIRRIEKSSNNNNELGRSIITILGAVWPIVLTILIYALLPIGLLLSACISIALLLILEKPPFTVLKAAVKTAFSPRQVSLVFGIISFQKMLEISDAVGSINILSTEFGFPDPLIIILVAFAAGILTGMLAALVGLSFPILAGYLYQPDINLNNFVLAFAAGYVGMIFSPTHFCLILTNEYFRSNLGRVYRILAPPLIILFLVALILYLFGYPWGIFA